MMKGELKVVSWSDHSVVIRSVSTFTGKTHEITLPLGIEAFSECMTRWQEGERIQHAFPTLSADQREFLMTGSTPEEWDAIFKDGE